MKKSKSVVSKKETATSLKKIFMPSALAPDELPELRTVVRGAFEVALDAQNTFEDNKLSVSDLLNFTNYSVYVNAYKSFSPMRQNELKNATAAQLRAVMNEEKQNFDMQNERIEFAVESIVIGIIGGFVLAAELSEKEEAEK